MRWRWAALVALTCAAGCGDGGAGLPAPDLTVLDGIADQLAAASCGWELRCCTGIEMTGLQQHVVFSTEEQCMSSGRGSDVRRQLQMLARRLGDGTLTVDPAAASSCADAYRNRPCNRPANGPLPEHVDLMGHAVDVLAACPGVLTGHRSAGYSCTLGNACAAGLHCSIGDLTPPTTLDDNTTPTIFLDVLGMCVPLGSSGAKCFSAEDCDRAAGLTCWGDSFTCGPVAREVDEPCATGTSPGGNYSDPCDSTKGLYCNGSAGVCRHMPGAGEPCRMRHAPADEVCDPDPALGLVCAGKFINGTGVCTPAGAEGDPCGGTALAPCRQGLACAPTQPDGIGMCAPAPVAGQPCGEGGVCAASACDFSTGLCSPQGAAPIGAACETSAACASLNCASFTESKRCSDVKSLVACAGNLTTPGTGVVGGTPSPP